MNIFKLVDIKLIILYMYLMKMYLQYGEAVEGIGPQKLKRFVSLTAVVLLKFSSKKTSHTCAL